MEIQDQDFDEEGEWKKCDVSCLQGLCRGRIVLASPIDIHLCYCFE